MNRRLQKTKANAKNEKPSYDIFTILQHYVAAVAPIRVGSVRDTPSRVYLLGGYGLIKIILVLTESNMP